MTGWPGVSSPKLDGERHVLGGREVGAGEEDDPAAEQLGPDGGDGVVVERRVQVEPVDLGADDPREASHLQRGGDR